MSFKLNQPFSTDNFSPRHPPAKSPLLYTGNIGTWQRVLIESDILCKSRVAANGQIACNFDPEFLVRARKLWRFQFPAANMQISCFYPKRTLPVHLKIERVLKHPTLKLDELEIKLIEFENYMCNFFPKLCL